MELLLNLAWLLLALPACWLWRSSRTATGGRNLTALQCLLALGCMLVILFPVVSATDDLRAMRSEMEESPASKRTILQASNDKVSAGKLQTPLALASTAGFSIVIHQAWQPLASPRLFMPAAPAVERAGRAPPRSVPA